MPKKKTPKKNPPAKGTKWSEIVAGMKAEKTGIANIASKVLSGEIDKKWNKQTSKAFAKAKKDKTRYAGD